MVVMGEAKGGDTSFRTGYFNPIAMKFFGIVESRFNIDRAMFYALCMHV
jgi:hypothetical protein